MPTSHVPRAVALIILAAACEGGPGPDGEGAAPTIVPIAAPGPAQVIVTNTEADPVKTRAIGTTSVEGSVAASQSGAWSVHVDNPSLTVGGSVSVNGGSVAAFQGGAWAVAVSEPVALAPGASVEVSALPPVTLEGTPAVTVAGTASVAVAGTASVAVANTPSVTIAGAAQAVPVTGAVEVTNLPPVQEVTGTVAIARDEPVWGSEVLYAYQTADLPVGLTLTDIYFSAGGTTTPCTGQIYVMDDTGDIIDNAFAFHFDEDKVVGEVHLQTGIEATATPPRTARFQVRNAGCTQVVVTWSGTRP